MRFMAMACRDGAQKEVGKREENSQNEDTAGGYITISIFVLATAMDSGDSDLFADYEISRWALATRACISHRPRANLCHQVNVPKTRRTYCKGKDCKKHTQHKVTRQ